MTARPTGTAEHVGRPRLLQAGKAYAPHIGGIETVMRQVAEGAARAGWDSQVLVASDDRHRHAEHLEDVAVARTATWHRALSLPLSPGYPVALRRRSADALLVHEPTLLAAASLFADPGARRRFGRLLVWWHSDVVRQRRLAPFYDPVQRRVLEAADRILVATPHHVTSSAVLSAYADKCDVVPYGIDLERYAWSPERAARVTALRRRLPSGPLVVYVGRLARYKGLPVLAEAMERVTGAHLVVVGDGPARPAIEQCAANRRGDVSLWPHADPVTLADLLWAADVFVLPSTQPSEAFGIVQLEAMACATPVVTFDLPTGVTWVNRHGETGLVAQLGDPASLADAITQLLEDHHLRHRLGRAARARVHAEFDERLMVSRALELAVPSRVAAAH